MSLTDKVIFAESEEYQIKVLSQMLCTHDFCDVASSALSSEDFSNKITQWYFNTISNAEIRLTPTTLREELLKAAKNKTIDKDLVSKYVEVYNIVSKPPVPAESEYIHKHMVDFIRLQACKRAVLDSVELLKEGKFSEIEQRIVDAANSGIDILGTGLDYFAEYQNRIARRAVRDKERKLSTGIPSLDELTYGGLKTKQLGLCVGGTGRGKSLFLQWLAKVAILLGEQVVYLTFELSEEDVADRFDSMFAHVRPHSLEEHPSHVLKELSKYHNTFGSSLFIKEYPEDEATVADIKAYLLQLTAKGIMPGLIIVDYVDLLKPHRTYHDLTHEQSAVIKALRGLSKSLDTRVWTACQLNRGGLSMETPDESAIAGGVSRLFTCDIGMFLAQTHDEREQEIMRIVMSKNRNGKAGKTIQLDTDYEFMTFYRPPAVTEEPQEKEECSNEQQQDTSSEEQNVSVKSSSDMLVLS